MSRISYNGHVWEFKTSTPKDGVIDIEEIRDLVKEATTLIKEHKEIRSFTVLCPINCFDSRGRVEKELRLLKRAVTIPVDWAAKAGFNHFMESIKRENDKQLLALIEKGLIESAGPQDGE